jgi:GT2 family glycosyltransferase
MYRHCFICPTYGAYSYARAALESFFRYTEKGLAVVVDDAHPGFFPFWDRRWHVVAHQFKERGGVTRSWNYGLSVARKLKATYAICGNSDILFSPGWEIGPTALLKRGSVGLVGPLSNGPGLTNVKQNIWDHLLDYQPSDDTKHISAVAERLASSFKPADCLPVWAVNGFFMIGRTKTWWEGRYDRGHVFNPAGRFAMVDSENELQRRLRACGRASVVSLRTFIFHYRSVTRGDKFKHGMWHRRSTKLG